MRTRLASMFAVLLLALAAGAASTAVAADGAAPAFDFETGGAAAAVGEATERSIAGELDVCGRDSPEIAKAAPRLMTAWRKRNKPWLAASLRVRAAMRAQLMGGDEANNGPIFDRNFEQAIAGVAQRATDQLRGIADPAARQTACRDLVAAVKDGGRDVSKVNDKATEMLRGYMK